MIEFKLKSRAALECARRYIMYLLIFIRPINELRTRTIIKWKGKEEDMIKHED